MLKFGNVTHRGKTMPVVSREVSTEIGEADLIEIECSVDGIRGNFTFHTDGDVTMTVGRLEVVMTTEGAKDFISALSERVNRD